MKWIFWGFSIILISIVIIADTYPQTFHFITQYSWGDKVGHFFLMGFFALLLNLILRCHHWQCRNIKIQKGLIIAMGVVMTEEISQIWLSTRTFSGIDLIADAVGILIFSFIAKWICNFQQK